MELYDRHGAAIAYCDDGEHIFDWGGRPSAFFSDDRIYLYSGKIIGWIRNGWIYDLRGNALLFSENSSGGPVRPARRARPAKGARSARPAKGAKQAASARPAFQSRWSDASWSTLT